MTTRLIVGDCRQELAKLKTGSVHCVVTSPPYFGLRDYGTGEWQGGRADCDHVVGQSRKGLGLAHSSAATRGGAIKVAETPDIQARGLCPRCGATRQDSQIGLEPTPAEFVAELVAVFREVWRVLRDDGTVWLNIGDSYANDGKWGGSTGGKHVTALHGATGVGRGKRKTGIRPKSLMLIPARLSIALQEDGWIVRSDVIWSKSNAMPESVVDRPTSAHEHVFLLTKSERYFYDAEAIKVARASDEDAATFRGGSYVENQIDNATLGKRQARGKRKVRGLPPRHAQYASSTRDSLDDVDRGGMRNARNVWTIATVPYKEAHFATFPPALAEPCVKAGTSARGCCPKCGAGWTRVISKETAWASNAALAGTEIAGKGHPSDQVREDHDVRNGPVSDTRTLGFYPSCSCDGLAPLAAYPAKPALAASMAAWRDACAIIDGSREIQCRAALDAAEVRPAVVLDPFAGAGTVGLVASRLQRHSVLIELNPASAELARSRLQKDGGLFVKIEP